MKPWPNPVEKKRSVLCEVNAFIARVMDNKKEAFSSSECTKFNQRAIAEGEEGRELMKKALLARFPEAKKRKRKAEMVPPRIPRLTRRFLLKSELFIRRSMSRN